MDNELIKKELLEIEEMTIGIAYRRPQTCPCEQTERERKKVAKEILKRQYKKTLEARDNEIKMAQLLPKDLKQWEFEEYCRSRRKEFQQQLKGINAST